MPCRKQAEAWRPVPPCEWRLPGEGLEHATREYHARLSFPRPATLRVLDKPIYSLGHLSRRAWDARMDSAGHSRASSHHHGDGFVGVIYGDIGTTSFRFSVVEPVERNEFVQVEHETCGTVLGRVDEVERKTDLSLDRAQVLGDGEPVDIEERVSAQVSVIGYRDDRGLLQVPRTPFRAGGAVSKGETATIQEVIGLTEDKKHGAYVGLLAGHDVPVYLDINAMVQKHVSIVAKTGAGTSYIARVRLRQAAKDYTIRDIVRVLEREEDPQSASLVDELEYLSEVEIFAKEGTRIDELVLKSKTPIINLKGVPPDIQELVVNRLATAMFELRKVGRIPPMMLVVEESHNFCPQVGQAASSKVFRTLASEGRKFGLGLVVITQRAAKVDKNVLSQCNTQIILKVTNPNDLKAIIASVEGLTTAMAEEISRLPIGVAIMTGGGLQMPLMVEVRPRETRHGGESVKVIED